MRGCFIGDTLYLYIEVLLYLGDTDHVHYCIKLYFVYRGVLYWEIVLLSCTLYIEVYFIGRYSVIKLYFVYRGVLYWEIQCY